MSCAPWRMKRGRTRGGAGDGGVPWHSTLCTSQSAALCIPLGTVRKQARLVQAAADLKWRVHASFAVSLTRGAHVARDARAALYTHFINFAPTYSL